MDWSQYNHNRNKDRHRIRKFDFQSNDSCSIWNWILHVRKYKPEDACYHLNHIILWVSYLGQVTVISMSLEHIHLRTHQTWRMSSIPTTTKRGLRNSGADFIQQHLELKRSNPRTFCEKLNNCRNETPCKIELINTGELLILQNELSDYINQSFFLRWLALHLL